MTIYVKRRGRRVEHKGLGGGFPEPTTMRDLEEYCPAPERAVTPRKAELDLGTGQHIIVDPGMAQRPYWRFERRNPRDKGGGWFVIIAATTSRELRAAIANEDIKTLPPAAIKVLDSLPADFETAALAMAQRRHK